MLHMMFGEVSPGGVGVGLIGMLIFALLAVFIAGLMVGRTPEYLGKKIQAAEMKLVTLYILAMPFALLPFAAASVLARHGGDVPARGPRAVGGALQLRLERQQQRLGVRLPGHRHPVVHDHPGHLDADRPVLHHHPGARHRRLAGRQAQGPGDRAARCRPTTPLFGFLIVGVIVIVAGLTFFPALALGPILEQLSSDHCEDRVTATIIPEPRARHQRPPKVRTKESASKSIFDRRSSGRHRRPLRKLNPRTMDRNPVMFIVEVGSVLTTMLFIRDFGSSTGQENAFAGLVSLVALVHGAVRQLRRSDGRRAGQGAGRHAAQDPGRDHGPGAPRRRHDRREAVVGRCSSATCASSPPAR